ncbi:MAG: hypothetical protein DHS20C15_18530 [Planctomycetota bacterium]|nr:MAG: hypothetical protein DHS20C15_18530 [Planctomycetota bacterium]
MKIQWDFEKVLLAVMGLLILTGLGFTWFWNSDLKELERRMPAAERQLADIGRWTFEIDELDRVIADEPFAQGTTGFEYLERQMVQSHIGKKFRMDVSNGDTTPVYRDQVYSLRPKENRDAFTRQQIAHFLIFIELNTRRMTVTKLRLDLAAGRGSGPDDWKPIVEVTDRSAVKL